MPTVALRTPSAVPWPGNVASRGRFRGKKKPAAVSDEVRWVELGDEAVAGLRPPRSQDRQGLGRPVGVQAGRSPRRHHGDPHMYPRKKDIEQEKDSTMAKMIGSLMGRAPPRTSVTTRPRRSTIRPAR